MSALAYDDTTRRLTECSRAKEEAADRLFAAAHDQLRFLTGRIMRHSAFHRVQPTALVHEVFLRLVDHSQISEIDRTHFLGMPPGTVQPDWRMARAWFRCQGGRKDT